MSQHKPINKHTHNHDKQKRQSIMDESTHSERPNAGHHSHRSDARDTTDLSVTASHKYQGRS